MTYYISTSGSTTGAGTSSSAPITLSRLGQILQDGDTVRAKCGDVFGPLIIQRNNITVEPYGTGAKPIFQGSQKITGGWQVHSGKIRKVPLQKEPKYAIMNGQVLEPARWPNAGSLLYNTNGSKTTLSTLLIAQSPVNLVGARVHVQTQSWCYESAEVTAHSGSSITHKGTIYDPLNYSFGLWFTGKLQFIDQPNEWYYDNAAKILYVWSDNPDQIEWVTEDYALNISYNRNGCSVKDVELRHAAKSAAYIDCGSNNTILGCTIHKAFQGVLIAHNPPSGLNASNNIILRNEVYDCYEGAIITMGDATTISNNNVHDIALKAGWSQDFWGGIAIVTKAGKDTVISYNTIKDVGYIAIGCGRSDNVFNNNIKDWCLTLNDGAGIAFDRGDWLKITGNYLSLSKAAVYPACPVSYHGCILRRKGIYFGENTNTSVLVADNVIIGAEGPGIFCDNSMGSGGNVIRGNAIIDCTTGLGFSDWSNNTQMNVPGAPVRQSYDHTVTGNVIIGALKAVHHINAHFPTVDYGNVTDNYYYSSKDPKPFFREQKQLGVSTSDDLKGWQTRTGEEAGSVDGAAPDYLVVVNDKDLAQTIALNGTWEDLSGRIYTGSILMDALKSIFLLKKDVAPPPPPPPPGTDYSTDTRKFGELEVREAVKVIQYALKP